MGQIKNIKLHIVTDIKMGADNSKVKNELKQSEVETLAKQTHFNEKEIKVMYKRFWTHCAKDGNMNKEQFAAMFDKMDGNGKNIVDHMFRATDIDDNFAVDFPEFLRMISVLLRGTEVQKMIWIFHLYDENDDGVIRIDEIEDILRGCSNNLNSSEISTLFHELDTNQDGTIDVNEFAAGCRRNNLLIKIIGLPMI